MESLKKYNTEQRCLIEKYLIENDKKFVSSKDILDYVKKNGMDVGLTTIYRTLSLLEKENKVRVELRDHTKYYQYVSQNCSKHFHLKCKKCGKMEHLDCKEFMHATEHIIEDHNFEVDYNTIIYGVCGKCAKK